MVVSEDCNSIWSYLERVGLEVCKQAACYVCDASLETVFDRMFICFLKWFCD